MNKKILFVDDDANLLAGFQRGLRKLYEFDTALGGEEGLAKIRENGPYAVIVADMTMPGMDGVVFLEKARALNPAGIRLMLTGNADQQTAVDALNRGEVFRFLTKPCPPEVLQPALDLALKQYEFAALERELIEGTLAGCVKVLTEVLGLVAPDRLGRGQRLRDSIRAFARQTGHGPLWELELGAQLSSIGYAAIPPSILRNATLQEPLTVDEYAVLRRAPKIGHDLLVDIPRLGGVAKIVLYQEKNFDGTGLPNDGLAGEALPPGSRLLKILNDRLVLEEEGVVKQNALKAMRERKGVYDPVLLEACFTCFSDFLANALSAKAPVRCLGVADLRPGQVIVSDLTTPEGLPLVTAGSRLTAMLIERLRAHADIALLGGHILVQDAPA
ncbi:MAG: HD domain-containing phosphohydrolase [Opitutaceae bacterium]|jgi:response regulator RpfG family c-di-GMP phosphodiesterase